MTTIEFTSPGPGGWKRLADHFPGALTPEYQRIYVETCPPSMAAYMRRYGVLAATLDVAFVHGHLYVAPSPLAGPREFRRTPPAWVVWLASRLHPGLRSRNAAARRALRDRPWRDVAQHWFTVEHAQWRDRCARLEEVDPSTAGASDLVAHLHDCRSLVTDGYRRHFELHGDDLLPVGLLLARCAEWGVDPGTALLALCDLTLPFTPSDPAEWMLVTGYDLDSLAWCELARRPSPTAAAPAGRPALDIGALVPEEHHGELERLIEDAQVAVPLRYHNGMLTGAWPMGLLRRAMVAAGTHLGLAPPELAVELTVAELVAALEAGGPLPVDPLERRRARARQSALPAPPTLGPEFAIPPLGALPRPLALIGAAQVAASEHMFGSRGAVGIGAQTHTGRALVVDDPSVALDLIEPGDVVVTRATSPAWNAVLGQAGALVTSAGGLVCHAALLARELDIPAVIGDHTAMERFRTGDVVTVDPVGVVAHHALPAVRFGPG